MAQGLTAGRVLLTGYLIIVHLLAALYLRHLWRSDAPAAAQTSALQPAATPLQSAPVDSGTSTISSPSVYAPSPSDTALLIPVAGIKRGALQDTYNQSRDSARQHNAIDIMAPAGTPVLAAADGEIAKFFDSKAGGITIYQWNADHSRVFYYAHLQRRADGLVEGTAVKRGIIIGYVGDSGNAGTGNYHLHFGISIPKDVKSYWGGTDINPYPLLRAGLEAPSL